MYDMACESIGELGTQTELKRIAYDSAAAKQYGRIGTAHDIAEWSGIQIDWGKIRDIVTEGWSQELDDILMPCKNKADAHGWLMTPVLIINNEVVCSGYVPEQEFVTTAIKRHARLEGATHED
jgi:hypothetical protein